MNEEKQNVAASEQSQAPATNPAPEAISEPNVPAEDAASGTAEQAPPEPEPQPEEAHPQEEASEATDASDADSASSIVGADPRPELRQLMELAVKHREIGPPLAELAFKIGQADIGERIVRMGLDDDQTTGVEYYAVAVDVARREGRYEDVFNQVEDALRTFAETEDAAVSEDEANRLLHLVRNAFAVLLFDLEDVNAKPEWMKRLGDQLPRLSERYADDPFYHSLLAQALWFEDKEKSEATWDKAVQLADAEFAWNARGTWYKDAVQDFDAAQAAYRKGLEAMRDSALLLHNLAQLLTDEAEKRSGENAGQAREWLREADGLVRKALRKDARRGLRRYIHGTKDRIQKLLNKLPMEQADPPKEGDVLKGRVVAVVQYGCFVTVKGGFKGLLHKSELAWERVNDPNELVKIGDEINVKVLSVEAQDDGSIRVGFSRKALLKAPEGAPPAKEETRGGGGGDRPKAAAGRGRGKGGNDRRGGKGGRGGGGGKGGGKGGGAPRGHTEQPKREDGMGSLGELLLAKLEQASKSDNSE